MSFVAATARVTTFQHTIEALSAVLNDIVLYIDSTGLYIGTFDAKNTCLVNVTLEAAKFDTFELSTPHNLGINLQCLLKVLKTIKLATEVTLVNSGTASTLEIRAKLKNHTVIHKLATLELDKPFVTPPVKNFDVIAKISSPLLYTTIRTMSQVAEIMELYASQAGSPSKKFEIRAKGSFSDQYILFEPSENFDLLQHRNQSAILGKFNLKTAAKYTKGANLSKMVRLSVSQEFPLNLIYATDLGTVSYCIAAE